MAADGATRPQKTHNIAFEIRRLCYRWHPWYDREVLTRAGTGVRADISYLCRLPDAPVGVMLVEIPRWMFDTGHCASARIADFPHVDCTALQVLKRMLAVQRPD